MTSTPSRARCSAVLRPMPRLAPVMSAMLGSWPPCVRRPAAAHQRSLQPGTSCPWLARARASHHWRAWTATGSPTSSAGAARRCGPRTSGSARAGAGGRAGLRREEVAALAHMSTDFYARLEQRRGSRPSEQTVGALARALRLTLDERDHLLPARRPRRAGARAPHRPRQPRADARARPARHARPRSSPTSASTLRQNPLAEALLGVQTGYTGLERSVFYRWFTDPGRARPLARPRTTSALARATSPSLRAVVRPRCRRRRGAASSSTRCAARSPEFTRAVGCATRSACRLDTRKRDRASRGRR